MINTKRNSTSNGVKRDEYFVGELMWLKLVIIDLIIDYFVDILKILGFQEGQQRAIAVHTEAVSTGSNDIPTYAIWT